MSQEPKRPPLYVRVRETLRNRIRDSHWQTGQALPTEFELADELGVSQGTVRKALEELVAEHLVERRQGLGTFVASHTPQEMLFRYFRLKTRDGGLAVPDSCESRARAGKATAEDATRLGIMRGDAVIRIQRIRTHLGRRFVRETIVLPKARFPAFDLASPPPNGLYSLYQHAHRVIIVKADERLTIEPATADDASALGIARGAPLLVINRIAYGIGSEPVEWRLSRCDLGDLHYEAALA